MFSYDERIRAVELYFKLGKRSAATRRQLGCPAKQSLASWCREFDFSADLRVGYSRSEAKYSEEQKRVAIEHYINHGPCFSTTLRALGYPCRAVLTAWVHVRHPQFKRLAVGKASRQPRSLPAKQAAVYELCTRQESAQAIAQRLDVDRVTLYNWKNQLLGRDAPASMKRIKDLSTETTKADLERQVEALRRDMRHLQLERDPLKKANEIIKKDLGVILQLLSNREKTMLVDALKDANTLPELLDELFLARSSYFYHRARLRAADKYCAVRGTIADIFESNHRCYGSRRIWATVSRQRVYISEKVVRRLMRQESLVSVQSVSAGDDAVAHRTSEEGDEEGAKR